MSIKSLLSRVLVPIVIDLIASGIKDIGNAKIESIIERIRKRTEARRQLTEKEFEVLVYEELETEIAPMSIDEVEELNSLLLEADLELDTKFLHKKHLLTLLRIQESLEEKNEILEEAIEALKGEVEL